MKQREPSPDLYRVIFRAGRWKSKSERHFAAYSVDEALNDFYHVFLIGHIHAKFVTIIKIEKYDRFADKWFCAKKDIVNLPEVECPEVRFKPKLTV